MTTSFDTLVPLWFRQRSCQVAVRTFEVRFPSNAIPGDLGWHIDLSFPADTGDRGGGDYSDWRINVTSRGRALLMLFLFSDVEEDDAPTRIRVGSHTTYLPYCCPSGRAARRSLNWRKWVQGAESH
jgi:hypothetical protein